MDEQPGKFGQVARPAGPDAGHPRRARRGAMRRRRRRPAFTLIEILIVVVILGILAAIVVPQFSNASHVARENVLKDDLRYIRTQIAVYKAQHRDVPPGFPARSGQADADTFKRQMTGRTDELGQIGPQYRLGPYLQKIPPNPLTQADGIMIVGKDVKLDASAVRDEKLYGWIYKPHTQEIVANTKEVDGRGRPYVGY